MAARSMGPYELHWRSKLDAPQPNRIVCLAFSPHADFLACGSDNGDHGGLVIWSNSSGEQLQHHRTASAVVAVMWHPGWRTVVVFGCATGEAFTWNFRVRISPFSLVCPYPTVSVSQRPSESPCAILLGRKGVIHAFDISLSSGYLAIAVDEEVHVARELPSSGQ